MHSKTIPDIYPPNFSDDQKQSFDLHVRQAKQLYPDFEEWSIKLAVEAFVRLGDKERPELTPDEIEAEKQKHNFESQVFETKIDENALVPMEERATEAQIIISSNIRNESLQAEPQENIIS